MLKNPALILFLLSKTLVAVTIPLTVNVNTDVGAGAQGTFNTGTMEGDLRGCLNYINIQLNSGATDNYNVTFTTPGTIGLSGILPAVNNSGVNSTITIGNASPTSTMIIDGGGNYPGFFLVNGEITFQNMVVRNMSATGGAGGSGVSGGGGGMGAGGAFYLATEYGFGVGPNLTLINVSMQGNTASGGDGGNGGTVTGSPPTTAIGAGGGGGFRGNGGSISISPGPCGGAGGGGFGGDGGSVVTNTTTTGAGGGSGGGGTGSATSLMGATNLATGGDDNSAGGLGAGFFGSADGSGGAGAGGFTGGANSGGGGGGNNSMSSAGPFGGGGGGSTDGEGGNITQPGAPSGAPSGGAGAPGGGGGGGAVLTDMAFSENFDGAGNGGGYGGGGGGGSGFGLVFPGGLFTVEGGDGGYGGGGGGGGVDPVNMSYVTPCNGGDSNGGGGGGGGGPTPTSGNGMGGTDASLGGGTGGTGTATGGGGGGGGSGLGGAMFIDSNLNPIIQTGGGQSIVFNGNTASAGVGGTGAGGGGNGLTGSSFGTDVFIALNSSLTLTATNSDETITFNGSICDPTAFGGAGGSLFIGGSGTVIFPSSSSVTVGFTTANSATVTVNGTYNSDLSICSGALLNGIGQLINVFLNTGTLAPGNNGVGTIHMTTLSMTSNSSMFIEIGSGGASLVDVSSTATLGGTPKVQLSGTVASGDYTFLTAGGGLGGTVFDFPVVITGQAGTGTIEYTLNSAFFRFSNGATGLPTAGLQNNNLVVANYLNSLSPISNQLGLTEQLTILRGLPSSQYTSALESISPSRNSIPTFVGQNTLFIFSNTIASHLSNRRMTLLHSASSSGGETALLVDNAEIRSRQILYAPPACAPSSIWASGFGQFGSQDAQNQTPAFTYNSGGLFAAYEYGNAGNGFVGALLGYAHASIQENHQMGQATSNGGYASLYGTANLSNCFFDIAFWGSYADVDQTRHISYPGFSATAESNFNPSQFDFHAGIGYDYNFCKGAIEPFGQFDFLYEWDPSYQESGASPYNIDQPSRTSWMLRVEAGFNGYITGNYDWGTFVGRGKLSYVYKDPHHVGHVASAIVGAPNAFTMEAFTSTQSLISPAVELFWQTQWRGYFSVSYDGEYGSGYTTNQFYGTMGYHF